MCLTLKVIGLNPTLHNFLNFYLPIILLLTIICIFHNVFLLVGRPRKGMATPKQRLGRIIKIHKMIK